MAGMVGFTMLIYCVGCFIAVREASKFLDRFKEKVKLNEINGISLDDLNDALSGKRIFWMGPIYEAAKRQKGSIDSLKAVTPDGAEAHEIGARAPANAH